MVDYIILGMLVGLGGLLIVLLVCLINSNYQ